jgi:aspartyl-tRNA(Asn)/glutamyl-tRNA(Gln) amidotransferase subunit A
MKHLAFASVKTLLEKLEKKEFSSPELISFFRNRFQEHDLSVGSALEIFDQESIEQKTDFNGLLRGIPGLIKDNICQENRITSCASKMLANYTAPYDATLIKKLKNQGASLIGRANMDEFAMGSSTETSAYKKTVNPWDSSCVPGGSSGGSAAAVAAGLIPWSLGTETGGSVRQPAALCGIVGSKPTYGLISRYGLVAYASSLDQVGVFSRTVYDNALILSLMAGQDTADSTTLATSQLDYLKDLTGKVRPGMTIGVVENALETPGIDPEVSLALEQALKEFEKLGVMLKRIRLETMEYAAAVYFIISRAEAASNLARFDGVRYGYRAPDCKTLDDIYNKSRHDGFGFEVRRRILIGNYVLSAGHASRYYQKAREVQALMRQELLEAYKQVDLIFMPTSPSSAFKFGAFDDNKLQMDLQDYFTAGANLTGMPAVAVPCGFTSNNMPIGFQLMGPDLSEALLFQTAHAYEQATPWHTMHPEKYA